MALKQLVFERARGLCEYCRSQAKYAIALKCSNFLDSQAIAMTAWCDRLELHL
ncbi:hypothetical protein G7B40_005430 [Aetokthonos hydrillicola Thurmond2011]|jgi:hypothetical protein|uniref:Uncharacterized protein n=1 Tax=Aetokthonos hydrillicola Thurmond2011 TaxID=2712845 RepID=A0AAP5I6F2_9CYAN|nr:hypothetical protein [Aetokthonos hydrillicola]MBW4586660.1 hypothetical protein [Aetokthonos hydrillicola CCALA 1050]MDR9894013.1 hypothetical protein [Aetokthonos hydrillicola Thurmond2011]